jgi:hypothetical protein
MRKLARCRQISHKLMGNTNMPWAKVSERSQICAMPQKVSRYSKSKASSTSSKGGKV